MSVLRILSGGATHGLVEKARAAFEKESGHRIEGTFGAVGAMKAKLLAGEPADLMILSRALIDELAHDGKVVANTVTDVASSSTSLAFAVSQLYSVRCIALLAMSSWARGVVCGSKLPKLAA